MKKISIILLFVFTAALSNAQCKQWFGESADSVNSIIAMVQKDIPTGLVFDSINSTTSFIHGANSRLTYIYRDTLKGTNSAHVSVKISYEGFEKLVGTEYVMSGAGLRSVVITAPSEWISKVGESFKKTISGCIIVEDKTFVLFGKDKNNTDRLLINGGQVSLFLESGLSKSKL